MRLRSSWRRPVSPIQSGSRTSTALERAWERIGVPVLLLYGERDQLVPVGESISKIEGALHRAGNQSYAAIIIPRAAHNLTVTPEPGEPFNWWRAAPGVTKLLTAWVVQQTRAAQSQQ